MSCHSKESSGALVEIEQLALPNQGSTKEYPPLTTESRSPVLIAAGLYQPSTNNQTMTEKTKTIQFAKKSTKNTVKFTEVQIEAQ